MNRVFENFIKRVKSEFSTTTPERSDLEALGNELKNICSRLSFDEKIYRPAGAGEELMYELCVDPQGGPSIYLVSDGAGVSTVPHEHQTWAIILGMAGAEFNVFYKPSDNQQGRLVARSGECLVCEGDILVMEPHEIHAIDASLGVHPTYHVHLYGCSLASLPSFNSRSYQSQALR